MPCGIKLEEKNPSEKKLSKVKRIESIASAKSIVRKGSSGVSRKFSPLQKRPLLNDSKRKHTIGEIPVQVESVEWQNIMDVCSSEVRPTPMLCMFF